MRNIIPVTVVFLILFLIPVYAPAQEDGIAKLNKLFVSPAAPMIESSAVNLSFGGVFGTDVEGSSRSHLRVGLGGVGELELAQQELFTNIYESGTTLTTTSLKIKAMPSGWLDRIALTSVSAMFRSSDWATQASDYDYIRLQADFAEAGVREIDFDSRFVSLYLIGTAEDETNALHFGPIFTDFRYKNLIAYHEDDDSSYVYEYKDERSISGIGGFVGFSTMMNPSTMLIFDLTTVPRLDYIPATKKVRFEKDILLLGGLRYFIHDFVSIDTGVRYFNSMSGLADLQVKLGLNVNLPIKRLMKDAKRKAEKKR